MITIAVLCALRVDPTAARVFVDPLNAACSRFDVNSRYRVAGFLAQCLWESKFLSKMEESLYYRKPERIAEVFQRLRGRGYGELAKLTRNPQALANAAYAGVNGNGDAASGDGWRYRGRGPFQLTGLGNYRAAEVALTRPYVAQPELVALPQDGCFTAAWHWHVNRCNLLADSAQWDAITRAVNGPAMLEADERRSLAEEALQVLP